METITQPWELTLLQMSSLCCQMDHYFFFFFRFFWPFLKSLLNLLQYCFCFMFWPQGDLSSSTRNQTLTSCVRSLNCWTTREVPGFLLFSSFICFLFYSPLWTIQKFTILLHPPYQTSAPFCSIDTRSPALFGAWGKSASAVGSLPTLWLIQTMVEKA